MSEIYCVGKEDLLKALEAAVPGDCMMISRLSDIAENSGELLRIAEKLAAKKPIFAPPLKRSTREIRPAVFFHNMPRSFRA